MNKREANQLACRIAATCRTAHVVDIRNRGGGSYALDCVDISGTPFMIENIEDWEARNGPLPDWPDYGRYVHETVRKGETVYVVAAWDEGAAQYTLPLTRAERRLNPEAQAWFSRTLSYFPAYATREEALRVARRLFRVGGDEEA